MKPKPSRIAKGVQDRSTGRQSLDDLAIVALIEIIARLLPFTQIHEQAEAVL